MDDVGGTITERRLIRARRIWIEEATETDEERGQALGDGSFAGPYDLRDY